MSDTCRMTLGCVLQCLLGKKQAVLAISSLHQDIKTVKAYRDDNKEQTLIDEESCRRQNTRIQL